MRTVLFALLPEVVLLDVAGPAEAFQCAVEGGLGLPLHVEAGADDVPVGIDFAAECGQCAAQLAYGGSVVVGGAVGDVYEAALDADAPK